MSDKQKLTRRKFTKEFKEKAVSLVVEEGMMQAIVADNLGIRPAVLGKWIKQFREDGPDAWPGAESLTPEQVRIRDLEKQVRRLKMEREILKKATAYFASLDN